MKKKIIVGIVLLICIGICIYIRQPKEKDTYTYVIQGQDNGINLDLIEWIGVAADGVSTCLVQYGGSPIVYDVIPGRYIIHEDVEGYRRAVFQGEECLGFEEYYEIFNLYLYDLKTKERTDICNIKELVEQNYPGCYISSYTGKYKWEGKDIYRVEIAQKRWENVYPWNYRYLYIDIEDGSYEEHEATLGESKKTCQIFYILEGVGLFEQNLPEGLLEEISIHAHQEEAGIFCVLGLAEYLPENNEVLYGMFPGLEQYRGEENCYICLYIGGNPTAEELLRLFMEDGQEISFEGAVLPGEYSIDGEDHEIHSFEEYEQWYDEGESTKE